MLPRACHTHVRSCIEDVVRTWPVHFSLRSHGPRMRRRRGSTGASSMRGKATFGWRAREWRARPVHHKQHTGRCCMRTSIIRRCCTSSGRKSVRALLLLGCLEYDFSEVLLPLLFWGGGSIWRGAYKMVPVCLRSNSSNTCMQCCLKGTSTKRYWGCSAIFCKEVCGRPGIICGNLGIGRWMVPLNFVCYKG